MWAERRSSSGRSRRLRILKHQKRTLHYFFPLSCSFSSGKIAESRILVRRAETIRRLGSSGSSFPFFERWNFFPSSGDAIIRLFLEDIESWKWKPRMYVRVYARSRKTLEMEFRGYQSLVDALHLHRAASLNRTEICGGIAANLRRASLKWLIRTPNYIPRIHFAKPEPGSCRNLLWDLNTVWL